MIPADISGKKMYSRLELNRDKLADRLSAVDGLIISFFCQSIHQTCPIDIVESTALLLDI